MRFSGRVLAGLVTASLMLAISACSGGGSGTDAASAQASVVPGGSPGVFPSVLSESTADTGRTVTSDELTGEITADSAAPPAGFTNLYVVVASGFGSFSVAVPKSYSAIWRAGRPASEIVDAAERIDPVWAADARTKLSAAAPDGLLRAVALDTTPADAVTAVFITLTKDDGTQGTALAEQMWSVYGKSGRVVDEAHAVRVNGADGAYVEFTINAAEANPRVGMQVLVPDPPNRMMWAVTCEGPVAKRAELEPVCAQIAATFRPGPRVSG